VVFALRERVFTVRQGEVSHVDIGPNGAGKTTLYRVCRRKHWRQTPEPCGCRDQLVSPLHRKDVLFYLPDRIVPWTAQSVTGCWRCSNGCTHRR